MLDGLRGMAALVVLLGHMELGGLVVLPGLSMIGAGVSGVQLFFVLSSFLLATPLLALPPPALSSPRLWGTYFARRILRIYPLYTLVLVVGSSYPSFYLALFGPREISIVSHLLLQQGAKILWAIPVEMKFYFLLPLLAVLGALALRRSVNAVCCLTAALLVASAIAAMNVQPSLQGTPPITLAPNLPYFVSGFAAAVLHRLWRPSGPAARILLDGAGWLALLWWVAANLAGAAPSWSWPLQEPLARGLTWALVLVAAADAGLGLSALFRFPPLRLAGVVSFSIYLLHMPIVENLRRMAGWSDATRIAGILASVTVVSALSFLVVEYPFIELGRRLSRRRPAPALSSSPAPPADGAPQDPRRSCA